MKNMTLPHIAKACKGVLYGLEVSKERGSAGEKEASCVVIDSRKIEKDGIFIATRGEKVDGHSFIFDVAAKGALGVVCEKAPENCPVPYILVEDSFQALKEIAEYYRQQLEIKVVGITGSVGKTSTKEFIAAALSQKYKVLKTVGNFNNEIGLPLTVLSIRSEHEIAVLEMGISNFGEMHRLSKIARPDICVMTNIGRCHLENLGTREGIFKAKSEIFDFMNPDGYVFVNGDDNLLALVRKKGSHKTVHFGFGPENEIFASDIEGRGLFGSHAVIHTRLEGHPMEIFPVEVPLPGRHMIMNALAAAGVGIQLGLSSKEVRQGIAEVEEVGGRGNVVSLPGYTLIDGSYNANPESMKAAIGLLTLAEGRKVAALGDMFELGEKEKQLHAEVGDYAAAQGIDVLICVGKLSENMYAAAERSAEDKEKKTTVYYFKDRDEMLKELPILIKEGDTILIKASHGMKFEKVAEFLQKKAGF
ncbi:MAG: UDP-N-acetylmuramoyl-tripeptide--D-alanyl-D-alanine ligase [Clostridium sp.]|nr:UDP-N-acetylmuramoyl-tripeptide--D-alanyl-D-alanine ligase [Clostridium sp.]